LFIESSPAIGAEGTIYISSVGRAVGRSGFLHAITPDGKEKWKFEIKNAPGFLSPAIGGKNATIYIGGGSNNSVIALE
jgi:outer membrane protein assembly factor BamB